VAVVSPLRIVVHGSTNPVPAKKLASYSSPAVNDLVAVERLGNQLLVLGTFS
jgi:hypothetical protein